MKRIIIHKSLLLQEIMHDECGDHYPYEICNYIILKLHYLLHLEIFCGDHQTYIKSYKCVYGFGLTDQAMLTSVSNIKSISKSLNYILTDSGDIYISSHEKIKRLVLPSIKKMIDNENHTLFLAENGNLYLHNNSETSIKKTDLYFTDVKDIGCGKNHVIILANNGKLYGFGYNGDYQLGNYLSKIDSGKVKSGLWELFYKTDFASLNIKEIICGGDSSFVITNDDYLYGWGSNSCKQLGGIDSACYKFTAHLLQLNISNVKSVACGFRHTLILTHTGNVYSCGSNHRGQLGISYLRLNNKLDLPPIDKIACGDNHSVAITIDGDVYAWGANDYGQLGLKDKTDRYYPVHVTL